jgi:hypothetical protein
VNTWPQELRGLPALSVRQPWAWMLVHGGKDIENRTRYVSFRGRFLIHASSFSTRKYMDEALLWMHLRGLLPATQLPAGCTLFYGCIIGVAEVVDCVEVSDSKWFAGPWGLVVRNAQPVRPFIPCRGALGFFRPEEAA